MHFNNGNWQWKRKGSYLLEIYTEIFTDEMIWHVGIALKYSHKKRNLKNKKGYEIRQAKWEYLFKLSDNSTKIYYTLFFPYPCTYLKFLWEVSFFLPMALSCELQIIQAELENKIVATYVLCWSEQLPFIWSIVLHMHRFFSVALWSYRIPYFLFKCVLNVSLEHKTFQCSHKSLPSTSDKDFSISRTQYSFLQHFKRDHNFVFKQQ